MSKVILKPVLGTLLNGRYRVVEILSVKAQVSTYLAEDIYQTDSPKCLVKQIEPANNDPEWWVTARLRFANVVQTLKKLGTHPQIPELIGFFEENQSFYVVHEWIEGKSLSAEFVPGQPWNEERVVLLLQEVLSILEFVRRYSFIHGNITPETFIRRASDGKLVLIDFGCESQICSKAESAENCNQATVDVYALGIIAIAALSGLNPEQLVADTDIKNWRGRVPVPVSNQLATVLNQMLQVNIKETSMAAAPTASVEDYLPIAMRVTTREDSCLLELESSKHQTENLTSLTEKPSSRRSKPFSVSRLLITGGLGLGVTANAGAMIFGLTTLLEASQIDPGQDIFTKASEEYKSGDFKQALALAKSIPTYSAVYYEARNAMQRWENEWNQASHRFQQVEKAFKENRWLDVFREAEQIPDNPYWQKKLKPLFQKAALKVKPEVQQLLQAAHREVKRGDFAAGLQVLAKIPKEVPDYAQVQAIITEYKQKQTLKLEAKAQQLLKTASAKAASKDFSSAVKLIRQIPKGTSVYELAQAKLIEYSQQRRLKADGLLQQANQKAAAGDFVSAIKLLKRIPKGTSAYFTAQSKLLEYINQREIQTRRNTPLFTPVNRRITPSRQPQQRASENVEGGSLVSQSLNPGDLLQEIDSIPFNLPG
ncbi:MAG: protein kinase [Oscillatoriaceae bacterium SKW80]|nr:protein kinase [Oscillatoriaceae bacterium SKYG93]MCX8121701.1 protein kinase [Oscillatoriaceae bacterium SKW80]MDW8453681.1 protein kinase [Oscillatoriaceae cyanobacterium SKYGB_i_bin93]HIK28747.1 protein kinase [Oscillatoriaceae cyanobacterium M7585_C2015_266]